MQVDLPGGRAGGRRWDARLIALSASRMAAGHICWALIMQPPSLSRLRAQTFPLAPRQQHSSPPFRPSFMSILFLPKCRFLRLLLLGPSSGAGRDQTKKRRLSAPDVGVVELGVSSWARPNASAFAPAEGWISSRVFERVCLNQQRCECYFHFQMSWLHPSSPHIWKLWFDLYLYYRAHQFEK